MWAGLWSSTVSQGCLICVLGEPSICIRWLRPTHPWLQEANPPAFHLLCRVRFIAWCLRHPFLEECWQRQGIFVPAMHLSFSSYLAHTNKKGLLPYSNLVIWFGLVWFYGISTFVGYLTPNPFYVNNQFSLKQFGLAWVHSLIVKNISISTYSVIYNNSV